MCASARHVRSRGRPAARPRVCCGLNLFSAAGLPRACSSGPPIRREHFGIAATSFRRPSFPFLLSSFFFFNSPFLSLCAVFFLFFWEPLSLFPFLSPSPSSLPPLPLFIRSCSRVPLYTVANRCVLNRVAAGNIVASEEKKKEKNCRMDTWLLGPATRCIRRRGSIPFVGVLPTVILSKESTHHPCWELYGSLAFRPIRNSIPRICSVVHVYPRWEILEPVPYLWDENDAINTNYGYNTFAM